MEWEEKKRLLGVIRRLCGEKGEIDGGMLAPAAGLSPAAAQAVIEALGEEGLVSLAEYGFSCSVEIMAEGLTAAGEALVEDGAGF